MATVRRSILLVDDHPVVRQGIARILATAMLDIRISEAVDGTSALQHLRTSPYHLVLLDLTLPGDSGLSLLRRIRREFPATPILVVSMHPVDQFAQRALQAGASGYVTKDSDPQELVHAARVALSGGRYIPTEVQEAVRQAEDPSPHTQLSDREYQVLRLIGGGRTVSEIGTELGLSVKTVSTYRGRILEKLQLRTSAELIHYAIVHHLVP
jgi:two-component system, NarL family, invasion response regulator UvrY